MFHDGEEDGGCAGRNAAFIASAPIMASIIRQLVDIVTQQHEAGKALAGMTRNDGMTRNEAMALWNAALALSAPIVNMKKGG